MNKRTKGKLRLLCLVLIIIIVVVIIIKSNKKQPTPPPEENISSTDNASDVIDAKVNELMNNMSIEEKIAQMLVLYYTKDNVDEYLQDLLQTTPPGGFILMKENITTYDKTKKYVDDLKKYSNIPLIISIDQEGGTVQRLQHLSDTTVTDIPFMYNLGQTNDTQLAYEVRKSYG